VARVDPGPRRSSRLLTVPKTGRRNLFGAYSGFPDPGLRRRPEKLWNSPSALRLGRGAQGEPRQLPYVMQGRGRQDRGSGRGDAIGEPGIAEALAESDLGSGQVPIADCRRAVQADGRPATRFNADIEQAEDELFRAILSMQAGSSEEPGRLLHAEPALGVGWRRAMVNRAARPHVQMRRAGPRSRRSLVFSSSPVGLLHATRSWTRPRGTPRNSPETIRETHHPGHTRLARGGRPPARNFYLWPSYRRPDGTRTETGNRRPGNILTGLLGA